MKQLMKRTVKTKKALKKVFKTYSKSEPGYYMKNTKRIFFNKDMLKLCGKEIEVDADPVNTNYDFACKNWQWLEDWLEPEVTIKALNQKLQKQIEGSELLKLPNDITTCAALFGTSNPDDIYALTIKLNKLALERRAGYVFSYTLPKKVYNQLMQFPGVKEYQG